MKYDSMGAPSEILPILCKARGKWGMFCLWSGEVDASVANTIADAISEIRQAAPWLSHEAATALWVDDERYFFFATEQAMCAAYAATVGDDGPTPTNPYDGPIRIYALTCSPVGELLNENT